MTAVHDFTGLRRGNSFRRTFCFKELDGDPVDLTGSVLLSVIEASVVRIVTSMVDGSPVSRCSRGFIAESSTALASAAFADDEEYCDGVLSHAAALRLFPSIMPTPHNMAGLPTYQYSVVRRRA